MVRRNYLGICRTGLAAIRNDSAFRRDDSEALRNSSAVDRIAWGFSRRDLEFLRIHLLMHRNDLGTFPPDQPLLWSGLESFSIDRGMHRNDLEVYGTTSGLSGRTWSFNSLAWD